MLTVFASALTLHQGAKGLREGSAFRFIAEAGTEASRKHDGLLGQIDLNTWVTMSIQRVLRSSMRTPRDPSGLIHQQSMPSFRAQAK